MEKKRAGAESAAKKGYIFCICAGLAWGCAGVSGQFLFEQKLWDVNFMIPLRMFAAGLIMLLLASRVEKTGDLFKVFRTRRNRIDLLIFASMGVGMCQYSYYATIAASNATTATILCYLGPVLITLWVALRSRALPAWNELVALAAAVAGTFFLTTHGDLSTLVLSDKALFWGLISAVATAIYSVQPKRVTAECGTLTTIAWGMLLASVGLFAICQPWKHVQGSFDITAWIGFFVVVMVGSILCYSLYFSGLQMIGPTKASILSVTELIVSAILSVLWLHVVFLPMDYLGIVLVGSTVFILALPVKKKECCPKKCSPKERQERSA